MFRGRLVSLAQTWYASNTLRRRSLLFLAAATGAAYYEHTYAFVRKQLNDSAFIRNAFVSALPHADAIFLFRALHKGVGNALCDALIDMHNDPKQPQFCEKRYTYLTALQQLFHTYANDSNKRKSAQISLYKLGTLLYATLNEETHAKWTEMIQSLAILIENDRESLETKRFFTLEPYHASQAIQGFLKLEETTAHCQSRKLCIYAIASLLEKEAQIHTKNMGLPVDQLASLLAHGEEREITNIFQYVHSIYQQRNLILPDAFFQNWLRHLELLKHEECESIGSWRMLLSRLQSLPQMWKLAVDMQILLGLARELHDVNESAESDRMTAKWKLSKIVRDLVFDAKRVEDICLWYAPYAHEKPQANTFFSSFYAPMRGIFSLAMDVADLPVYGAEEYDASTELGWMDLIASWSVCDDVRISRNAVMTLERLGWLALHAADECEVDAKQLLQAWLMQLLQSIRGLYRGQEVLAIRDVERVAAMTKEDTPGSERILYNPLVIQSGVHALGIFAEKHDKELLRRGVLPLLSLLAMQSQEDRFRADCARVIANLAASACSSFQKSSQETEIDICQELRRYQSGSWFFTELSAWKMHSQAMVRSNYYRAIENLRAYDDIRLDGHTARPVYHEGVNPIPTQEASSSMQQGQPMDIVLIHGLRGDPFGTWRRNYLAKQDQFWPEEFLIPDLEAHGVQARILTLGYEAGMVTWSSPWPSLSLEERAKVLLNALYEAKVGITGDKKPQTPVIFLTHSLGGLLIKEMLLLAQDQPHGLNENTAGIVFLAVPHFGSDLVKGIHYDAIRSLIQAHPAVRDICANRGRLEALNHSFQQLQINCLSLAEAKPSPLGIGLSAMIVKPEFANPGTGEFRIIADADHMTICKATSKCDPIYKLILQYILEKSAVYEETKRNSNEKLRCVGTA